MNEDFDTKMRTRITTLNNALLVFNELLSDLDDVSREQHTGTEFIFRLLEAEFYSIATILDKLPSTAALTFTLEDSYRSSEYLVFVLNTLMEDK